MPPVVLSPPAETAQRLDPLNTETIDGIEYNMPSPLFLHQELVAQLVYLLRVYLTSNHLGTVAAAVDIHFEDKITLCPDLLFISHERSHLVQRWVEGAPDLVMEVVSDSSLERDTVEKRAIYQKFGVQEYWIILPTLRMIEVLKLEHGKYQSYSFAKDEGQVQSAVLPGFVVDVAKVFQSFNPHQAAL